jgi:hypothetical protein
MVWPTTDKTIIAAGVKRYEGGTHLDQKTLCIYSGMCVYLLSLWTRPRNHSRTIMMMMRDGYEHSFFCIDRSPFSYGRWEPF